MPVVTLIRTGPSDAPGSMPAYANLVIESLNTCSSTTWSVRMCEVHDGQAGHGMWRQHAWRALYMQRSLLRAPTDFYHLLDGAMAAFIPGSLCFQTVVSVHDLIPMRQMRGELPGRPSLPAAVLLRHTARALRQCRACCVNSMATAADLKRLLHICDAPVIPLAVRALPFLGSDAGAASRGPEPFVLHVGHNGLYKNREGVLRVYARLRAAFPEVSLVMVGPEPTVELRERAALLGKVMFHVHASDSELSALYRRAELLLFPSLYEGFGMPVLEAMSLGCPVVCSPHGALSEVAADAALLAPAGEIEELVGHCRRIMSNPVLRGELVAKGKKNASQYTLKRMSMELITWYDAALKRREAKV